VKNSLECYRATKLTEAGKGKAWGMSITVEVGATGFGRTAPKATFAGRALKRLMDVGLSLIALVILFPLFLIVAVAIKLDSRGPVFFRQTRRGLNGVDFEILKFRSMTVMENGALVRQACRQDPRVSKIGYWLRRTSIDELPQLINVVRGDMSLVGPRPHALAHDDYFRGQIAEYPLRQRMKPGITGWAQVSNCRGETPTVDCMRERVLCDLWYIENWSILLDFRIISRTISEVVRETGY
jgi:putative colanic acid biosynthesis UDP-glucose lipid carrier transferase